MSLIISAVDKKLLGAGIFVDSDAYSFINDFKHLFTKHVTLIGF